MNFYRLDRPWNLADRIIVRAIIFALMFGPLVGWIALVAWWWLIALGSLAALALVARA